MMKTLFEKLDDAKRAVVYTLEHAEGRVDFHGLVYWATVVEDLRKEIRGML